jgi:hypothetical protein
MVTCFKICFNFAFNFNLRRYTWCPSRASSSLSWKPSAASGRGLHSFTLELNLSTFETHSWVKLGYVGHKDSSS